jgi:hypothetical protein
MSEKGKGKFIENLRIIQLVEADLNFVLPTIWGHRLARHAMTHSAMNQSQYALPGQTCNNAVLNKLLYLDLSRQTLSPGIMMDYNATAAFDRVLAGLSIITCQRMGLPYIAGTCMFHLLRSMNFHLMTGFGRLVASYHNSDDPILQGSSSVAPIFIFNSDVSLTTYCKLSKGAAFIHPISGDIIEDKATQYMDDTTQLLNHMGAELQDLDHTMKHNALMGQRRPTHDYGMISFGHVGETCSSVNASFTHSFLLSISKKWKLRT